MFPDLFSATTEYWRQLDEIEYRYKQGELSLEEVDREVEMLMKQLGKKRRESLAWGEKLSIQGRASFSGSGVEEDRHLSSM